MLNGHHKGIHACDEGGIRLRHANLAVLEALGSGKEDLPWLHLPWLAPVSSSSLQYPQDEANVPQSWMMEYLLDCFI
jgi:hypothetical protein